MKTVVVGSVTFQVPDWQLIRLHSIRGCTDRL